jgi:AcrR family transcriptional regulator
MNTLNDKQIQILQVAEKLFAEKGFDGTSIRNIAKEAGINIAMVSYYFGSKEKMLEALIFSRTSDLKMQLENILKAESEPMEKLDQLLDLYIARVSKNRCLYQIVNSESANVKRALSLKSFTEVKKRNLESLQLIIAQGQEKGIFRKDINVSLIPATIFGTYFQFYTGKALYEEVFNLNTEESFTSYIKNELTAHIKQLIKALLTHEIK